MAKLSEKEKQAFRDYAESKIKPAGMLRNCVRAFWVGGLICVLGQFLSDAAKWWLGLPQPFWGTFASVALIFLGATFTGIGIFDDMGRYAGAGTAVPITGFANSMVAPALEYKTEGFILGVAAKMFTISGPVLVYGMLSALVAGAIRIILGVG